MKVSQPPCNNRPVIFHALQAVQGEWYWRESGCPNSFDTQCMVIDATVCLNECWTGVDSSLTIDSRLFLFPSLCFRTTWNSSFAWCANSFACSAPSLQCKLVCTQNLNSPRMMLRFNEIVMSLVSLYTFCKVTKWRWEKTRLETTSFQLLLFIFWETESKYFFLVLAQIKCLLLFSFFCYRWTSVEEIKAKKELFVK